MRDKTTTTMCYQVEANGVVQESMCSSLRDARKTAEDLKQKGCTGVQIVRYDRSGKSDYYEIVEVL
jgi:hypothetical protein